MSYQTPYDATGRAAYGGPPAPAKRSGGCLRGGLIAVGAGAVLFVLLVVAIGAALSGSDDDDGGNPAGGAAEQDVFAVGDTAHTGDFDVTVHGVTDPFTPANEFDAQPAAGNRFVAVELTMTNTSSEPLPLSTLTGVEITDHQDRLGSFSLAGAAELPRLDAPTVAPGEARRGWVVFEVAADAAELELRVKGNLTATGSLFQL